MKQKTCGIWLSVEIIFLKSINGEQKEKMMVKRWVKEYGGCCLLCFYWEVVQQLIRTQPRASTGSNRTEQHVNALLERRLRRGALPEEARSVKRQVVVSRPVRGGSKKDFSSICELFFVIITICFRIGKAKINNLIDIIKVWFPAMSCVQMWWKSLVI